MKTPPPSKPKRTPKKVKARRMYCRVKSPEDIRIHPLQAWLFDEIGQVFVLPADPASVERMVEQMRMAKTKPVNYIYGGHETWVSYRARIKAEENANEEARLAAIGITAPRKP